MKTLLIVIVCCIVLPLLLAAFVSWLRRDNEETRQAYDRSNINRPPCFGSRPTPQEIAENDCGSCVHCDACHKI